jgi:phosphonate transport system ATP-binding protein
VALLGLNGAGKSSLLRAILGLLPLAEGSIRINDILLTPKTLPKIRDFVGSIFQGGGLVKQLSALDNVLCGKLGSRSSWETLWGFNRQDRSLGLDLLDRLGLEKEADRPISKLSGGQQQKVAIARALIQSPQILLADEPTAGLDAIAARQVMSILADLNRDRGLTVVTVLHDLALASAYATRTIVMDRGKIIYNGDCDDLQNKFYRVVEDCRQRNGTIANG